MLWTAPGLAHIAGPGDDLVEGGDALEDRGPLAFLLCVESGEFFLGSGETYGETFDFAEPSLALGFRDPVGEVVADLDQTRSLCGGDDEYGAW